MFFGLGFLVNQKQNAVEGTPATSIPKFYKHQGLLKRRIDGGGVRPLGWTVRNSWVSNVHLNCLSVQ